MMRAGPLGNSWRRLVRWSVSPTVVRSLTRPFLPGRARRLVSEWPGLDKIRRLGVIRHDGLGDLMVTTGFLRELRRAAPQARITLLTRPEWIGIMRQCAHVDEILGFPVDLSGRWVLHCNVAAAWKFARRELWPREWEAVLVPQSAFSFFESRYLAFFSGAPLRIGRRDASSSATDPGWHLLNQVIETPAGEHEAVSCARLLAALGMADANPALELKCSRESVDELEASGLPLPPGGQAVALGIGASQAPKLWPLDHFVEIARRCVRRGWPVVLVGGQDSREAGRQLAAAVAGVVDATDRLSLPATAALLSRCRMYVGNDSGPMHVAAAIGIPVAEIVGWPADVPGTVGGTPKRIGPFCAHRRIAQPATTVPAATLQIERVTVDQVWDAVESLEQEISAGVKPTL